MKLFVISHTHWDREWYEPFQTFRFRLVRMIDELLEIMESDPEYRYFHFDGQTIVLEDYLEIRPENEARLKALIQSGRIAIGPWYVMPDEFLVNGESHVRNLQKGIEICSEYGVDYMHNGYVTDIFGHNAQLPQIFKGFDIDTVTFFRGIETEKDTFTWKGADGTEVTAFRLDKDRCYSNYYFSVRWPFEGRDVSDEELLRHAEEMTGRSKAAATSNAGILMDGVDHIGADRDLPRKLRLFNENIEGAEFIHAHMDEYIKAVREAGAQYETVEGPLYSIADHGVNNSLLKNVLSSQVHLKQANDACETKLALVAEPLDLAAALLCPADVNRPARGGFLKRAWKYVLQNHPHDSICGCSISDVHKDNEYRFRQAGQIIDRITRDSLEQISESVNTLGAAEGDHCFVVYNPSQLPVSGFSMITLPLPAGLHSNFRLYDADGNELSYQKIFVHPAKVKILSGNNKLIDAEAYEDCELSVNLAIPPCGHTLVFFRPCQTQQPGPGEYCHKVEHEAVRPFGSMRTARNIWDNGLLTVSVTPGATLKVVYKSTGKVYENLLTFEDCGDVGEGWNYIKPLNDAEVLSLASDCSVAVLADGPYAVRLKLRHNFTIPAGGDRHGAEGMLKLSTIVTLIKDSHVLTVNTSFENTTESHRLRVLFPTDMKADKFYTSTPFQMQDWPVVKPDVSAYKEIETKVSPNQGTVFMSDGGNSVALFTKGLYEVEACAEDATLALTLMRCFPQEVAQTMPENSQLQRKLSMDYAIGFYDSCEPSEALRESNRFKTPPIACPTGLHEGTVSKNCSYLTLNGRHSVLSALQSADESAARVRLYNPSAEADEITLTLPKPVASAWTVDFLDNKLSDLPVQGNSISCKLEPEQIVTVFVKISK